MDLLPVHCAGWKTTGDFENCNFYLYTTYVKKQTAMHRLRIRMWQLLGMILLFLKTDYNYSFQKSPGSGLQMVSTSCSPHKKATWSEKKFRPCHFNYFLTNVIMYSGASTDRQLENSIPNCRNK